MISLSTPHSLLTLLLLALALASVHASTFRSQDRLHQAIIRGRSALSAINTPLKRAANDSSSGTPVLLSKKSPFNAINYTRSAWFSQSVYCIRANSTKSCASGACLGKLPQDTQFVWMGGDDQFTPFVYVAWTKSLNQITVVHEGTNINSSLSLSNVGKQNAVPAPFSAAPNGSQVHDGISAAWKRTWPGVRSNVLRTVAKYNATNPTVVITGHSLGAAIAYFDAIGLRMELNKKVKMRTDLFALLQPADLAFVEWANGLLGSTISMVSFKNDPVIHATSWSQIPNEIFLDGVAAKPVWCPGIDNIHCSKKYADFSAGFNQTTHNGPFFGLNLGREFCVGYGWPQPIDPPTKPWWENLNFTFPNTSVPKLAINRVALP